MLVTADELQIFSLVVPEVRAKNLERPGHKVASDQNCGANVEVI